jgi:thiol-disulfide isomerase/thioredoxin
MKNIVLVGCWLGLALGLRADPGGINPPDDSVASAGASDSLTAQQLWSRIGDEGQRMMAGLQKHDPAVTASIPQAQSDLGLYLAKYPTDAHVAEAKLMLAQVHDLARGLKLPGAPTQDAVDQEFSGLAADPKMPDQLRAEASLMVISSTLREAQTDEAAVSAAGKGHSAKWDEVEAKVTGFEKSFGTVSFDGKNSAAAMLRGEQIHLLQESGDADRLKALLAELANDPNPEIVALAKQAAAQAQAAADLKTKPLDLKFTAVDGSAVDLAQMRGKVVLIDFWATWCPPCREEVPNVVAAYQKYHGQGFEIVGISLDQDKSALQSFTKEKGMVWPQYFDGQGWDNAISSKFGIQSIPAMWLVGKDGVLVTQDGRDDLAGQVQKLLQAK